MTSTSLVAPFAPASPPEKASAWDPIAGFAVVSSLINHEQEKNVANIQIRNRDVEPSRECLRFLRKQNRVVPMIGDHGFSAGVVAAATKPWCDLYERQGDYESSATEDGLWVIGGAAGTRFGAKGGTRVEFHLGGAWPLRGLIVPAGAEVKITSKGAWFLVKLPYYMAQDLEYLHVL